MTGVARYLAGAMLLALIGAICLAAGLVDRRIAYAQREFAAERSDRADEALETAERYLQYGRWLPWIGGTLNDVRTYRAAMRYWSGRYDQVAPDRGDPFAAASENSDLQLIAANAVYRRLQPTAKDKRTSLEGLQAAASAYLTVLKNAPRGPASDVAAYNYEFVVRTREDIDKGRRDPDLTDTAEDGPAGRRGGPPPEQNKRDLKLLVPLEPGEMDKGVEPGKGGAIERKG